MRPQHFTDDSRVSMHTEAKARGASAATKNHTTKIHPWLELGVDGTLSNLNFIKNKNKKKKE